ncbi:hypothetical protein CORC01_05626 [Colletotrichum orchidophilum]|uniref:Uncharacterized protein n=1 Tax=Colletotrichum orchidophilum TaxID=1209926 RepID=A0A1G4BCL5_9PEZI|nr:uncharacterized protein CORC01_05626 [Colletotrichum orchidophilum]OHE99133.1 hypothetical protein CORC01_05626 [Colletotrichum orchidophilum]
MHVGYLETCGVRRAACGGRVRLHRAGAWPRRRDAPSGGGGAPPFLFHARPAGPEPMSANVVHAVHTESPVCHARAHFTRAFRFRNDTRYDAASRRICNVLTNLCCGMQCGLPHHYVFRSGLLRNLVRIPTLPMLFWASKVHDIPQNISDASFECPAVSYRQAPNTSLPPIKVKIIPSRPGM